MNPMPRAFIESPCIRECIYNYEKDFCEGCGRNLDEIGLWHTYSYQDKQFIITLSKKRLDELKQSC